jgi:type IV secretion system protein VirD4
MRAMPMTPPSNGPGGPEADAEGVRQGAGNERSDLSCAVPKKTAPVVQAVIAEEERQMEMDFGSQVADAEAAGVGDEVQMRSAVDGLDDMEAMLREDGGQTLVAR